jgi:hypothetical protein
MGEQGSSGCEPSEPGRSSERYPRLSTLVRISPEQVRPVYQSQGSDGFFYGRPAAP